MKQAPPVFTRAGATPAMESTMKVASLLHRANSLEPF